MPPHGFTEVCPTVRWNALARDQGCASELVGPHPAYRTCTFYLPARPSSVPLDVFSLATLYTLHRPTPGAVTFDFPHEVCRVLPMRTL